MTEHDAEIPARVAWRAMAAQTRIEIVLATRRYENLLVTIAIPVVLLVFFATVAVVAVPPGERAVDRLLAAVLAVAAMATGLVSLGIATAFERGYGVLKRLSGTPLPTWALLGAKGVVVVVTVAGQLTVLVAVAALLGWAPGPGIAAAVVAALPWLLLGTVTFSALGLFLAGVLRPEAVLAASNGLFLLAVLLGGVIVPLDQLPAWLAIPVSVLPPSLLAELLRDALSSGGADLVRAAALLSWAVALVVITTKTFRADAV